MMQYMSVTMQCHWDPYGNVVRYTTLRTKQQGLCKFPRQMTCKTYSFPFFLSPIIIFILLFVFICWTNLSMRLNPSSCRKMVMSSSAAAAIRTSFWSQLCAVSISVSTMQVLAFLCASWEHLCRPDKTYVFRAVLPKDPGALIEMTKTDFPRERRPWRCAGQTPIPAAGCWLPVSRWEPPRLSPCGSWTEHSATVNNRLGDTHLPQFMACPFWVWCLCGFQAEWTSHLQRLQWNLLLHLFAVEYQRHLNRCGAVSEMRVRCEVKFILLDRWMFAKHEAQQKKKLSSVCCVQQIFCDENTYGNSKLHCSVFKLENENDTLLLYLSLHVNTLFKTKEWQSDFNCSSMNSMDSHLLKAIISFVQRKSTCRLA